MKIGKHEVDIRIIPLVYTLSDIPFIETISSCGGHNPDYKANVIFNVKDEKKNRKNLDNLMKTILNETCKDWTEVITNFNKRYYSVPHSKKLYHNWNIDIRPNPAVRDGEPKRIVVEKEIQKIAGIARTYAQTIRDFYLY